MAALGVALAAAAPAPAAPDDLRFEGESMSLAPEHGDRPPDAEASGGAALRIWNNGTASKAVTTTRPTDHLFVRARGIDCLGAPQMRVTVDDAVRFEGPVSVGGYADIGVAISLSAGTHEVEISLTNDFSQSVGSVQVCDRNAYVDAVTLVASPFAANGWRNQPLPASTGVAGNSAQMVTELQRQITEGAEDKDRPGAWISTGATATIYTVGPDQKVENVVHDGNDASLKAQWTGVPIPEGAKPSAPPFRKGVTVGEGEERRDLLWEWGDANMVVWQPSSDTLWEFFHMRRNDLANPLGWTADYGGRMRNARQFEGQFGDPPGALYGASATSIAQIATLMRIEEVKRGVIDHAIGMTIRGAEGYDGWCWPAQRTDPQHHLRTTSAIPAGTRFRLPADFDLNRWAADKAMHPLGVVIARAIQRYGVVVSDSGQGVGFAVEDPASTGSDPFYANGQPRADGPFRGEWPDEGGVLRGFPWGELVALAQPPGADRGCTDDPDRG